MLRQPKIMILYASYGEGHYQVAKAIETEFRSRGFSEIVLLDLMAEAHPVLNEMTKFVYMQSFKTIPYLYGLVYNTTRKMRSNMPFYSLLHSLGLRKLAKIVSDNGPDLVIHTFPQLAMPKLLKRTGHSVPLVNVITDFDIHGRWVHPGVDRYYVATSDLKEEMAARGIPLERVQDSGIPLRSDFDKEKLRQEQNAKPVVLLMAGAYGVMQNLGDIIKRLTAKGELRVIAVCGRNNELYAQLSKRFAEHEDVEVRGFVQQIPELMAESDCIITKPGGITLSEAIVSRLPMFLFRPVPGQELNNARYLKKKGVAFISRRPGELVRQIEYFFANRQRREEMLLNLEQLRRPGASEVIVADLVRRFVNPSHDLIGAAEPS